MLKKPLSLKANFSWALMGNITYTVCQFLMLMGLAKLGNPQIVGFYTLALALTAPLFVFAYLNLRSIQATDISNDYSFSEYFFLRLLCLVAAGVMTILIAIFYPVSFQAKLAIVVLGCAKLAEAVSDIIHGILQQHERLDKAGISMGFRGIIQLAAIILALKFTHNLVWACISVLCAVCFVLLFVDIQNYFWLKMSERINLITIFGELRPHLRRLSSVELLKIKKLFFLALPMGVMALLDSLLVNVPRYILDRKAGIKAVGYYSAIAYLIFLANFVVTSAGQSLTPKLARAYRTGINEFAKMSLYMVLLGCGLGLAGMLIALLFGTKLLALLYDPEYSKYNEVFIWIMACAGLYYMATFIWYSSVAARILKPQPWILVAALIATIITGFLAIPEYGVRGAAWSLFAGMMVRFIGGSMFLIAVLGKKNKREEPETKNKIWQLHG